MVGGVWRRYIFAAWSRDDITQSACFLFAIFMVSRLCAVPSPCPARAAACLAPPPNGPSPGWEDAGLTNLGRVGVVVWSGPGGFLARLVGGSRGWAECSHRRLDQSAAVLTIREKFEYMRLLGIVLPAVRMGCPAPAGLRLIHGPAVIVDAPEMGRHRIPEWGNRRREVVSSASQPSAARWSYQAGLGSCPACDGRKQVSLAGGRWV